MNELELKSQFTDEFFDEFQFDGEFRSIFTAISKGLTPYQAIEHLCRSKKQMFQSMEQIIKSAPMKIVITKE